MCAHLPDRIDPWTLAQQGTTLQGSLPQASLRRLPAFVSALNSDPCIDLQLGIDRQGQAYVHGRIEASVTVICQRCLQPYPLLLAAEVSLGVVATEQAAERLATHYEPLIAAAEIPLADVIEDELLLLLPVFPRHPEGLCQMPSVGQTAESVETAVRRPFAELQALWQQRDPSQ